MNANPTQWNANRWVDRFAVRFFKERVFEMLKAISRLFQKESYPEKRREYLQWRNVVFSITSIQVGVLSDQSHQVYGVIMDVGITDDFIISITAFPTGESSLMTTVGGGVIGLGGDQIIADHAKHIISLAQPLIEKAKKIGEHNLPTSQTVYFYLLTTSGLMKTQATVNEAYAPNHPFHEMFERFTAIKTRSEELTKASDR